MTATTVIRCSIFSSLNLPNERESTDESGHPPPRGEGHSGSTAATTAWICATVRRLAMTSPLWDAAILADNFHFRRIRFRRTSQ